MNILIITNDYPPVPGGIANYIEGLHEGSKTLGHDCQVMFIPINSNYSNDNEGIFTFPAGGKWTFSRISSCEKHLKNFYMEIVQAELIIVSAWSPLGIAFTNVFPHEKEKTVLLAYGNDVFEPMRKKRYRKKMKKVFDKVGSIGAISNWTASLCNKFSNNKVFVIGGGINKRFLEKPLGIELSSNQDKPFIILSVGRLVERKGNDMLIKSLATINLKLSDWRYIIIGEGPYKEELKELITAYNLSDKIEFLDGVDNIELNKWYRKADIFSMLSREISQKGEIEGLGLVFMEAGAACLPVLAGNSGGIPDIVINEYNGLLVDPTSISEISDAVLRLYNNSSLRHNLGSNGRILAETEWQWHEVARKIIHYKKTC